MMDRPAGDLRPDPEALLERLHHEEQEQARGKLKIFFGYAAGVGKTYSMLDSALSQKKAGVDVVIGYLEPHARPETMNLAIGLERLPYREIQQRELVLKEFALDAALARRPAILLVDELAHSNAEGLRHRKRWQDVEELLAAGIDIYTTVNVQHIESLNDIVASITQVQVRETIPDAVFDGADQVELIDIEPTDLIQRLHEGKVYVPRQASLATQNFFTEHNLVALREIAMRRSADRIFNLSTPQKQRGADEGWTALGETLLVCLSSSQQNGHVIRSASRIAEAFHARWIALYVETPQRMRMQEDERQRLKENMDLAERLGARVVTVQGDDIAEQVVEYARVRNVSKIVIGKYHRNLSFQRRLFNVDFADRIIAATPYIDVYVIPEDRTQHKRRRFQIPTLNFHVSLRDFVVMLLVIAFVTLTGFLLQRSAYSESSIIILYLMGVLAVSSLTSGHVPGILSSVLSVLTFNFFFTEPKYTLLAYGHDYPLTFAVMFGAALLTTTLTSRIRRQARVVAEREKTDDLLLQTSRVLMCAQDMDSLAEAISSHLVQLLGRPVVCYVPGGTRETGLPEPAVAKEVGNDDAGILLTPNERSVAHWVLENARQAGCGTDTLPGSAGFYLPVVSERKALAVIGVLCANGRPLPAEQRRKLMTVTGQVALAVERELLDEAGHLAQKNVEREELRSNLLRAVSHDLRTPLTGISGAALTALENDDALDPATRKELLRSICDDADWLIQIVENLLSVTRIDEGRLALNIRDEVVEEIVAESLEHIEKHLHGHRIETHLRQSSALVPMDGRLVEQVLVNLVDNAVKYTPEGTTIQVGAWCDDAVATFEVRDDGPGIDEKDLPHLFDRFFTKGESRADARRGIGLGLSISRSIVAAHGGTLTASNASPHGAVFRFTLPMGRPREVQGG
jgi:two-component system, OmpR family, sensor histidine kinase KdpD